MSSRSSGIDTHNICKDMRKCRTGIRHTSVDLRSPFLLAYLAHNDIPSPPIPF
ncbi:uncharacterized protein K444DRAFT_618853 [Hyaloscypha bicolor E]|uniref:Uncharacterized protein n=1 Tax=Hyaloscypha bicolor E TaxID=1095630 RepID=A0A2J6SSK6_9HELO|nr:uncharacterized protein K444DRAFT_618853 [Hyaloscypha bicolor E]PMD53673.1 hypothetical protein K444DRAFT_618853 [Hyaloscypha bicolor E]